MMKTIIIGAGPAGMNAAIHAANASNDVTLIERNAKVGRKLYISGKGRCNLTNNKETRDFIANVISNPKFLLSAFSQFAPKDTIKWFEEHGCPLVTTRGDRVFPESYKSADVIDTMYRACLDAGVHFKFNARVVDVKRFGDFFMVSTDKGTFSGDCLVIATGGLSYPATGSTGDGYRFAKSFEHEIVDTVPALTGIKIKEEVPHELMTFQFNNVELRVNDGKFHHEEFGDLSFYDGYLDGPIVISTSSFINRRDNSNLKMEIDLKPALDEAKLLSRFQREIDKTPKGHVYDLLAALLPLEFCPLFVKKLPFSDETLLAEFNKKDRLALVNVLKHFPLTFDGLKGYERAVVTSGGVSVRQIDSRTMESKIVPNLYFVGEVLDVDAKTGGYNIQIALTTGAVAGNDIAKKSAI
ncbi:MAG: NAD(P)/FAD-dependent oxidoreductase [Bacilli bacterium]|nr:NAD(P)/FAD-dependent oxidoreductase [Bacilli bacterium]